MNSHVESAIIHLAPNSLAPGDALRHPDNYDWIPLSFSAPVDTTGLKNLRLECKYCGGILTETPLNGPPICEDCGAEDGQFFIYKLLERVEKYVPRLTVYTTPKGFLKIKSPIEKGKFKYTLDGSQPSLKNGHTYKKVFKMSGESCTIKVVQFWDNCYSQCVECQYTAPVLQPKPAPRPTHGPGARRISVPPPRHPPTPAPYSPAPRRGPVPSPLPRFLSVPEPPPPQNNSFNTEGCLGILSALFGLICFGVAASCGCGPILSIIAALVGAGITSVGLDKLREM